MPLTVSEYELHFYTRGTTSAWRKFCVESGILPAGTVKDDENFAKSFVLVEKKGRKWEAILGQVHTVGPKRKEKGLALHWHLDWQADAPEPPSQVEALSKRIGGRDGLFSSFSEKWPKRAPRNCDGSYMCQFETLVAEIDCLPWPESQPFEVGSRRVDFRPGAIDWELTPPIGTISALKIVRNGKTATLLASGHWTGEITAKSFAEARAQAQADLESLLEQCKK